MTVAQHLNQFLARLATDPDQLAAYLNDRDATIAAAELDPHDADALRSGDAAAIQRRLAAGAAQLSGSVHVPAPPDNEPQPSVHVPPPPTASVHVPPPPEAVPPSRRD
jgi:hypothetical protein